MSKPTIIMIIHAAGDEGIDRLNAALVDRTGISGKLTRVDSLAPGWNPLTAVHIGSFNHLDEPLFMRLVREAAWIEPARLQLLIEREDDAKFTDYDLFSDIEPKRIARSAIDRGFGLPAPSQQLRFFEKHRDGAPHPHDETEEQDIETASPWVFEVVAIHPPYYFESSARIIPYGNSTAIDSDGNMVYAVDLAFNGIGVRWGSPRTDIIDCADRSVRSAVVDLSPRDRIQVECQARPGEGGIVQIYNVRAVARLD